tara:strand:- start:12105 stop:17792 length:5688 start_codon:yes stop_codon:yes gene_type:complete
MSSYQKINLQLGDIIQIEAPLNSNYHQNIYFINYIDKTKIKLISEQNEFTLLINEDGNFLEESIENIILLHRNDSPSYVKQNNLQLDQYISIYFNEPSPFIINGIITNIEQDMIEVTINKTGEVIYIDFAFTGIPESLNIEKILIKQNTTDIENKKEDESIQENDSSSPTSNTESKTDILNDINDDLNFNKQEKIIFDEIDLAEELEDIKYNVNVSESEKRYSLDDQIHDYLNYKINLLKNQDKTQENYEKINKEINRFIELRELYSENDANNNYNLPTLNNEFYKPLKNTILNLNKQIPWILPVISNNKIILENSDESLSNENENEYLIKNKNSSFINTLKTCNENWIKNNSKEKVNDYKKYINELYELFDANILYDTNSSNVNTRLTVINNNNDNFYSYCIENNMLKKNRFITDIYSNGLNMLEIDYYNGKKVLNKTKLTNDDNISIKSFITMPFSILNYSKLNNDYTNILDKINLNEHNLYYFKLLSQNTSINEYILDEKLAKKFKNTDKNIHNDEIFKKINSFQYDILNNTNENYEENISDLLDSFLPTNNSYIKNIFENEKIYNLSQLLDLLYCADIDYYNIHQENYNIILKELEKKCDEYKINFIKNNKQLDETIKIANKDIKFNNIIYSFNLLNKELKAEIFQNYKLDESVFINNEELLTRIISIDNGDFLSASLNKSVIDLTVSTLLDSFIKQQERLSKKDSDLNLSDDNNTCEKFILSKKYNSIDEINLDNNKNIYFDSIYDKTFYSFINDYQDEKNNMDYETFKSHLINELKEKLNMTDKQSQREAIAIIEEKRQIIDGDYALLINKEDNKNYIYVRDKETWIISEKFKDNFYIDSNKIFCDINKNCISKDDKCNSLDMVTNKLDKHNIDEILKSFNLKYDISIEEIKGKIQKQYDTAKTLLQKKHLIYNANIIDNVLLKFNILDTTGEYYIHNEKLRDRILAYPDQIKKNYYIRIFALNFLRYSNSDENKYWLYCKDTDKKILPLFFLKLANVFDDKEKYLIELDTICAEQGTISDDNSFWVDKHSGYIIKRIEFSNDEGYDDAGYKLNTKELLTQEYIYNSTNKPLSKDTHTIYAIIKTIGQMLGLNLNNYNELINLNVLKLLKKNIPDKKLYEEKIQKMLKKDERAKNLPNYEDAYNNLLLMYTISYICIFIQTSIPSFTTKKTFPGCIKSFNGFPLNGTEDKTFVMYIACIVNKIKSSIKPWNTIQKISEINIVKKIEMIIKDNILSDKVFVDLIYKKLEYLKNNPDEEIDSKISVNNWFTFMPPLNEIKIKDHDLIPIDKNFTDNMIDGFKKSSKNIVTDLINSKIFNYTNKIIYSIQNVVKKKTPILQTSNGEPFIENSCCNSLNNTIQYFIEQDKSIYENNILLKNYLAIINDIALLEKPSILYHNQNTKINIPKISNDYDEIIIYKSFIHFCNFNNNLPINHDLRSLANNKPTNINYNQKIELVIEDIKSQGKTFSRTNFYDLLDNVNNKNILKINYNDSVLNNIENLRLVIEDYNKNRLVESYDETFIDKFYKLIDTYDFIKFKNDDTKDIKNYLFKVNNLIHTNIIAKIKSFEFVTKKELELFEKYIDFNFEPDNLYLFKNYLINFIEILPNIIINKSINYDKIPKHWKLSEIHNNDIKNIVKMYFEPYINFNNTNSFNIISNHIKKKFNILLKLSNYLMFYNKIDTVNGNIIENIFDKDLLNLIYKNFYLSLFNEYLNILENNDFELSIITNDENYDKNETNKEIFKYISNFLTTLNNHYNLIDLNYKKVKNNILFAKEKEKDLITDFLKNLTDESREIENIFKNNKLEKWNKGMQKGVTQYVKANYDTEREELDKQTLLEKKINKKDLVTDMNKQIFMMDIEEEELLQQQIDEEENDMSHIPDDDDADDDYEI